jgi:hypothetical protein
VKSSRQDPKTQLLCLEEKIQQADPKNPKRSHHTLSSPSPVASIHSLFSFNVTAEESQSHDVLVLHKDGTANCLSSALGRSVWTTQLNDITQSAEGPLSADNYHVEYAELTDVATAKRGLLKGREDVLALLQPGDSVAESVEAIQLLFVINSSKNSRSVHLYALSPRTSSSSPSLGFMPQHLLTWRMSPPSNEHSSLQSTYCLHASTGALEELCDGSITTHDFSGISPRIASVLKNPDGPLNTFVRLSSSLLLTASSQQYAIFDTKYLSLQASLPITSPTASTLKNRKRKSSDVETTVGTPQFIEYFAKAGISIALSGRQLLAVQISIDIAPSKRRKIGETLLIDSIGRGTDFAVSQETVVRRADAGNQPSCLGRPISESVATQVGEDWSLKAKQLDQLLEQREFEEFEAEFAECLGFEYNRAKLEKIKRKAKKGKGGKGKGQVKWTFPPAKRLPLHREKALYALGRIFGPNQLVESVSPLNSYTNRPLAITVQFDAPNIFYWLAITGQLTAPLIHQALHQLHKTELEISHGDVIAAVADFDSSLSRLQMIMESPARLDIEEIAQAIKAIIQSLDDSTLPKPDPRLVANLEEDDGLAIPARLMNGDQRLTNGDSGLTNGHVDQDGSHSDVDTDAIMEDLDNEIDYAIATLESGLPIRGESLRHALSKLNSFPSNAITRTLRRNLSQHEIVFLIHILRIELADGGWTSRYIDVGPDASADDGEPSDRALSVIAKVLGCAVDAMGMSGWLASSASDPVDSVDELLLNLRAEISASLEGVHEATFLTGVLSEFLRYPYKRMRAGWAPTRKPNQGAGKALKEGRVWRVEKAEEPGLPIGLKVEEKVGDTYVRGGGAIVELSKKEKGKELNRQVGRYCFEKIRI